MRRRCYALAALPLLLLAVAAGAQNLTSLQFAGHFRAKPKTTMLPGPGKELASVQQYLDTVVKPLDDNAVRQKFPAVLNANAHRVAPEKHVVTVHAKLYAVRLEAD